MKRIIVRNDDTLIFRAAEFQCCCGKGGRVPAHVKREGDGATPIGVWPLRSVWFRPDRLEPPVTRLAVKALQESDGWCDAPDDANYNRHVTLPYDGSHERLWRDEPVYDVIVVLGHNDAPVVPGLGSAIFLHVAHSDYRPTEGCVALALEDLLSVLEDADPDTVLEVKG